MTEPQFIPETEEQYNLRFDLGVTATNLKLMTAPDSGWKAIWDFLGSKIDEAAAKREEGRAKLYTDLCNQFFRGHFGYVTISYKHALEKGYSELILSKEEAARKIKNAKRRVRELKKKAHALGIDLAKANIPS